MKKTLSLLALFTASATYAHEPFLAPMLFNTHNAQVPIMAAYAEDALQPEFAMKDVHKIQALSPSQKRLELPTAMVDSITFANLELNEIGTYSLSATASYPLYYVYHDKKWKQYFDVKADTVAPLAERVFVIPSDFATKPDILEIQRHWILKSFLTKGKASEPAVIVDSPIQVQFSQHPTQFKAKQDIYFTVTKDGKPLNKALVEVKQKAEKHDEAKLTPSKTDSKGEVKIIFPEAGQYVVTINEVFNAKQKPSDQYYTIMTFEVTP